MEEHFPVDISIRNVPVRLNESSVVGNEMNGENMKSLFVPTSSETDTQVTHFNEDFENKRSSDCSNISDEFNEKLRISQNTENCGLINGCNKLLKDDMKCVHISVNGIKRCNNYELINTHLEQLSNRTCVDNSIDSVESKRTESNENDYQSVNSLENLMPNERISVGKAANSSIVVPQNETTNCELASKISEESDSGQISYLGYDSESQMPDIMRLIQKDLSEPYSIYTYRYFIHNWPKLCFLALDGNHCVGAIVCKLDVHKKHSRRGYIAMLAVDEKYRKRKIGSNLVLKAIDAMVEDSADEVVLETEITNKPALRLYENLGFVRDKRLFRYYLNGVDALRLKLWLR